MFVAMPPLEAKRMLFSRAVTRQTSKPPRRAGPKKLMFIDVRKAHLNPKYDHDVYIDFPAEAGAPEGYCGKLVHWLYGFRPAGRAWEEDSATKFESIGLARGKATPTIFSDNVKDLQCVAHGDDFTFLGFEEDLLDMKRKMEDWYGIKMLGMLGPTART